MSQPITVDNQFDQLRKAQTSQTMCFDALSIFLRPGRLILLDHFRLPHPFGNPCRWACIQARSPCPVFAGHTPESSHLLPRRLRRRHLEGRSRWTWTPMMRLLRPRAPRAGTMPWAALFMVFFDLTAPIADGVSHSRPPPDTRGGET